MSVFHSLFDFSFFRPDPRWASRVFTGGLTKAGAEVNDKTALTYIPFWGCVFILAKYVGMAPLFVYERRGAREREKARGHHLFEKLRYRPNPEMSALRWKMAGQGHLATWGNFYSFIERSVSGRILGLWPLRPDWMREIDRDPRNGLLRYIYSTPTHGEQRLGWDEVLHIPGLGFDGLRGYSPTSQFRESIGLGLGMQEFGSRLFGEGTHPGAIVRHKAELSEQGHQNLRDQLLEKYSGLGNSHKLMLLEEGMEFDQVGIPPQDAQMLESRKWSAAEIAGGIFQVPPHMIGELSHATFSNISEQRVEFLQGTMGPWFSLWEEELHFKLLLSDPRFYVRFETAALHKADLKTRYDAYAVGRQWGWLSANDVREKEDEPTIGEGGDIYMVPLNMIPAEEASARPRPGEPGRPDQDTTPFALEARRYELTAAALLNERRQAPQRAAKNLRVRHQRSYFRLYLDAAGRIVRREVNDVGQLVGKHLGSRDSASLLRAIEEFYAEGSRFLAAAALAFGPIIRSYFEDIQSAALDEIGISEAPEAERLDLASDSRAKRLAAAYAASSRRQLAKLIRAGAQADLAGILKERLRGWEETRPGKVALRESVTGGSVAAKAAWASAGVQLVRWRAQGRNCPFCSRLDGLAAPINGDFVSAGTLMAAEGAAPLRVRRSIPNPQLHSGCDCFLEAA